MTVTRSKFQRGGGFDVAELRIAATRGRAHAVRPSTPMSVGAVSREEAGRV